MVGPAARGLRDPVVLHRLHHVGAAPGSQLYVRAVSLAPVFAGAVGLLPTRVVRPGPAVLAQLAAVFAGDADPALSGVLPLHLLLLPRGVLQGLLGRPAQLRRR